MNDAKFIVRRMSRDELDIAIDWAKHEEWNPGKHDADCFYNADPNGFFLGLANGKPVAMVSAVAYDDSYGFMGFYIVDPDCRNKGYGTQLWDEGLKYLGDRIIGLDSVRPDLVSHRKPQFKPAYINFRYKWIKDREWPINPEIINLADVSWRSLNAYDYEMFSFRREDFLKCWISRPDTVALGVMNEGRLSGYGVIRACLQGYKVGPLFADNKYLAQALFNALTLRLKLGDQIFLDTPAVNTDSVDLAQAYGMTEVFRTTRMYNKPAPPLPLDKWFGVTSFELG